ncbi:hypothetical protein HF882_12375 [Victivallis vadensis]|uniref:Uncharacterized protein n=1 Tax=Victivallis vadensis TaxID=172901 RepID=A0A848AWU0_9BACT|nr:hypothetical protein [Victivallis vadensis]NMD87381.1 hypothetical protein [Victivallis vadensis]
MNYGNRNPHLRNAGPQSSKEKKQNEQKGGGVHDGECRVLHVRQSGGSVSRSGDAIANWVNESVTVSK